jgi:hypothetical protein
MSCASTLFDKQSRAIAAAKFFIAYTSLRHDTKRVSNIGCNDITVRVNRHDTSAGRHVWCIKLSKFNFSVYGGLFRLASVASATNMLLLPQRMPMLQPPRMEVI